MYPVSEDLERVILIDKLLSGLSERVSLKAQNEVARLVNFSLRQYRDRKPSQNVLKTMYFARERLSALSKCLPEDFVIDYGVQINKSIRNITTLVEGGEYCP